MAISRGQMTKQLMGNKMRKTKKMAFGGMAPSPGPLQRLAAARPMGGPPTATTALAPTGSMPMNPGPTARPMMYKKGGRIDGAARRGKTRGSSC